MFSARRTLSFWIAVPASRRARSRMEEKDLADGANYRLMPLHLAVTALARS